MATEIQDLVEQAERLAAKPSIGLWGAVVKANVRAAARNLKRMAPSYWRCHPDAYAVHVETLRHGVAFLKGGEDHGG